MSECGSSSILRSGSKPTVTEDVVSRFLLVLGFVFALPGVSQAQLHELRQNIFGMD